MKNLLYAVLLFASASLFAQSITVNTPNGGERWLVGSSQNITWTAVAVANVNIDLSTDNGATFPISIAASVNAALGTYNWTVPNDVSHQSIIRISDDSNPATNDVSNATFSIYSLTVTNPNGGERLQQNSNGNITWSNAGTVANVKIDISIDGGVTYPVNVTPSTSAATGSYTYNFPITPSSLCKVKISDAANANNYDVCDNNFTVGSLSLTAPDGNEHIQVGKSFNITWTANQVTNVKLEYSTDNGTSWLTIASSINAALGTYSWTVPNTASNSCKVKISDVATPAINDLSSAVFTIVSLALTSPNGGENLLEGSTQTITWSNQNVGNVKLEYSINGGTNYTVIQNSVVASLGSYNWTVPAGVSSNCFIKVSDAAYPSINDESNATFTISSLSLDAPLAAAIWREGSSQNITWTSANITNLKIEYSTNNGTSWIIIQASKAAAGGTHQWTIPNTVSLQCKIKLTDISYPSNYVVSGVFTIEPIPTIVVTSPNGNENWKESSTHNITWSATYNIANVNIDYSLNNGGAWINIANNVVANLGTYSWTLPNSTTQQGLVRITNSADVTTNDVSDSPFIISSLNLTAPNGAERWQVGKAYDITWNSSNISNVKLEFSVDNGSTWSTIVASVQASNATYSWTVPDVNSTQAKVKISDASNSSINDISSATFTTVNVIITSPNGGESLLEEADHSVTWLSQNIANVKLEYSANSGTSWNVVVASTPAAAGTYTWSVPANSASTYQFRISDVADNTINDLSDAEFTVSKLNLTSPVGSEDWKVGTSHNVTWTNSATLTNVKLEYTTNNGSSWIVVASSVPATPSTYRWIIPNTTSANCKFKVSNVSSPGIFSQSQAFFTISKSLIVATPNGGENWEVGSIRNVTWSRDPAISFIRLEFTVDNGLNWTSINNNIDASLGTYPWTIPNSLSANCKVRITDVNNVTNIDSSDAKFSIVATSTITVTRPNGGEIFETGAQENITWNSSFVSLVKIEFSTNNGSTWNLIRSSLASTGSYLWNVPNTNSNQCKIKITDESNPNVFDLGDNKFTINPRIIVTSPSGGESLYAANTFSITWTSTNTANVRIDYSTDNGSNWVNIVASTPAAAGTYSWTVANVSSSACLIKVSDAIKPEVYDISDNAFSIGNKIRVVSPNGGESWQTSSIKEIQWLSNSIVNVAIAYSTNNGLSWTSIVASTSASAGKYNWSLPATAFNQYKIKVSDASNSAIYDISDNYFTIAAIDLTKPNGAESYPVGSTQTITWTSSYISKVKIEYSANNGVDWETVVSDYSSNGIYNWLIPNITSTMCLVKISESNTGVPFDISNNTFSITTSPYITLTSPNGNEIWEIGKTQFITWNSNNVTDVKLEYSLNNGSSWNTIITSIKSTGNYSWAVPNTSSAQCKVKITDASKPMIYDISDSVFTISMSPKIVVTYPNGNESIKGGSMQNITWTSTSIDSVRIEYSINNGVSWNLIAASEPSTGTYIWTVPEVTSYQCKVRILDTANGDILDISDNPFTIAVLNLLKPIDGETILSGGPYEINWTSLGITNLKIEYSVNDGTTWIPISASVNALSGKYVWNVPLISIAQCRVRISDVSKPLISDMNETSFSVKQIIVISPNEFSRWPVGSTQIIQWKSNNVANLKLDFSNNNGLNWNSIASAIPASVGMYYWIVPNSPSSVCLVRISDATNQNSFATNNYNFAIEEKTDVIVEETVPSSYSLQQNYPNPFNPTTSIRYSLPRASYVTLKVYDMLGTEIAVLVNGERSAGIHEAKFDGRSLASGVYIYRLETSGYSESRKLILMK